MWRAKLNHHIRVDHEAVIFKMGDDHFSEIEKDPTSHIEVVFVAPNLENVLDDGRFSGSIRLIDDAGNVKADNIQSMLNPDAWIDRTKDEWEMSYTRLHLFLPVEVSDGDSLVMESEMLEQIPDVAALRRNNSRDR